MESSIYGWRARMGYAGVTPLSTTPYEFWKMAPEGVALVTTGLHVDREFAGDLGAILQEIRTCLGALDKFGLDAITLGTSPLVWRCTDAELATLRQAADEATTAAVVFASDAVCDALAHARQGAKARRVAVLSPYGEGVNRSLERHLAGRGFVVAGLAAYAGAQDRAPFDQVHAMGGELLRGLADVDALYVCGDQWVIAPHIERLEQETGVTVVSDTSAMLWHLLARLSIGVRPPGHGRLLSQP